MTTPMSNQEFYDRTGLTASRDEAHIRSLGETILQGMSIMSTEQRVAFVDSLSPVQLKMLHILEMPEDLADVAAVERWLAQ